MISVNNLSKSIKGTKILQDISFTVNDGEILGFLGPNGAGKTSTMKIITGFWTPTSGSVTVNNLEVVKDSLAIRERIGYLPETVPLYEDMKVYEYLRFIAEIRGIAKGQIKENMRRVIKICGLEKMIKRPIEELSKGFRQRVGLAQAILHEPDILILDEPTTGLDPNQIAEIRNLIRELGQNKTVIFSTHILSEVQQVCDRVVIINHGRIVGQGTPAELARKVGARELIYVKIRGPREVIVPTLQSLDNIELIVAKDHESDDIYGYEITPFNNIDIREQLSSVVMQNNWSILEFSRRTMGMEDVFRELTK